MNEKLIDITVSKAFIIVSMLSMLSLALIAGIASAQEIVRPVGWQEASHSNKQDPNYDMVFPNGRVNTLTITVSTDNWQAMQEDMVELYGPSKAQDSLSLSTPVSQLTTSPASLGSTIDNPMWVPATISFNAQQWENVGFRYKGNSTLIRSWHSEHTKLPFKLDFDEFEDDHPEIKNQRFYGFKQLSLNNNITDKSYMRDAASNNIMETMGLAAPKTAWYNVYLDYGQGLEPLGIYTIIEVIDDTVIDRVFDGDKGNIYEADGNASSLAFGSSEGFEDSFEKENNKKANDYEDIVMLYKTLHSIDRQSNPESWRSELEKRFDVDSFLKWLAANTVIQNWDTYGVMGHNFYLYNNPATEQLSWIGWDYNEAFGNKHIEQENKYYLDVGQQVTQNLDEESSNFSSDYPKTGKSRTAPLDHSTVTNAWPLIRFLMDDAHYFERYKAYTEEVIEVAYNTDLMTQKYAYWSQMLVPYVDDPVMFQAEVSRLGEHCEARAQAVTNFVSTPFASSP